jgi:hypothetical protein
MTYKKQNIKITGIDKKTAVLSFILVSTLMGCSPEDRKLNRFSGGGSGPRGSGSPDASKNGDRLRIFPTGAITYLVLKENEIAQTVAALAKKETLMPRSLQLKGSELIPSQSNLKLNEGSEYNVTGNYTQTSRDEKTGAWEGAGLFEESRALNAKTNLESKVGIFTRNASFSYVIREDGILVKYQSQGTFAANFEGKRSAQTGFQMQFELLLSSGDSLKHETLAATIQIKDYAAFTVVKGAAEANDNGQACFIWSSRGSYNDGAQVKEFTVGDGQVNVGGYAKNIEKQCQSEIVANPIILLN